MPKMGSMRWYSVCVGASDNCQLLWCALVGACMQLISENNFNAWAASCW